MGMHISRKVMTFMSIPAVAAIVASSAVSASADTGLAGAGGGAYVGETLVATAWEGSVGAFTAAPPTVHPQSTDVYNYRIGIADGTIVDYQSTSGLEGLTEAEQDQWYVDAGLAPYTFDWFVFYCPATQLLTENPPTKVETDPTMSLDNVIYRSVDGAAGFPTFDNTTWSAWFLGVGDGSVFLPEIDPSKFSPNFRSNVQTPFLNEDQTPYFANAELATTYLNFSCPTTGYQPLVGRIVSPTDTTLEVGDRTMTLGDTIYFVPTPGVVRVADVLAIPAAGAYIGVTGAALTANAALWGVTHVNSGVRALPNTGVDTTSVWVATAGAVLLAMMGVVLVRIRRQRAR